MVVIHLQQNMHKDSKHRMIIIITIITGKDQHHIILEKEHHMMNNLKRIFIVSVNTERMDIPCMMLKQFMIHFLGVEMEMIHLTLLLVLAEIVIAITVRIKDVSLYKQPLRLLIVRQMIFSTWAMGQALKCWVMMMALHGKKKRDLRV